MNFYVLPRAIKLGTYGIWVKQQLYWIQRQFRVSVKNVKLLPGLIHISFLCWVISAKKFNQDDFHNFASSFSYSWHLWVFSGKPLKGLLHALSWYTEISNMPSMRAPPQHSPHLLSLDPTASVSRLCACGADESAFRQTFVCRTINLLLLAFEPSHCWQGKRTWTLNKSIILSLHNRRNYWRYSEREILIFAFIIDSNRRYFK